MGPISAARRAMGSAWGLRGIVVSSPRLGVGIRTHVLLSSSLAQLRSCDLCQTAIPRFNMGCDSLRRLPGTVLLVGSSERKRQQATALQIGLRLCYLPGAEAGEVD